MIHHRQAHVRPAAMAVQYFFVGVVDLRLFRRERKRRWAIATQVCGERDNRVTPDPGDVAQIVMVARPARERTCAWTASSTVQEANSASPDTPPWCHRGVPLL